MFKNLGKFVTAFIVTLALFFAYGVLTLGNMRSTGASLAYRANQTVILAIDGGAKAKTVTSVYVNIGTIYERYGDSVTVEIEYTSADTPSTTGGSTLGSVKAMANIAAEGAENGYNYNWLPVVTDVHKNTKYLFFKASANLDLNEIVCWGEDGEQLPLTAVSVGGADFNEEQTKKVVDAQKSFSASKSAYYFLSQEEGYYMTSVNNFLGGGRVLDGSIYNIDENYGGLATVFTAVSVAVFGDSAFALRLPSFMATCIMIVFLFLLTKELFKSEKSAYFLSLLVMLGGMATTAGRFGTPLPFALCAVVASAYFAYRFFAYGLDEEKPIKGCLTVLASGLFGAVAIALEILSVIPVCGVLAIVYMGVRRLNKAKTFALEKVEGETEEADRERRKITARYAYANRVALSFTALSFLVGTLIMLFLGTVIYYAPLVKAYDTPLDPKLGFLTLFGKGIKNSCFYTSVAGLDGVNILAWLIPLQATSVYAAHSEGVYLSWDIQMNAALQVLSLVAFICSAVKVICDFVANKNDKYTKRFRRGFFVILGGALSFLLAGAIKGGIGMVAAYPFSVFYVAFIPLLLTAFSKEHGYGDKAVALEKWLTIAVALVALVFFLLTVPAAFGFAVPSGLANGLFSWTTIL
jgi:hypothetical protein